ncbi:MAG TPA: FadR/GntR family transcriptional regulator [Stellaceae bacterium]|nr:FadR/GntR family transcriptional regulator [Stellaceae bacterium]
MSSNREAAAILAPLGPPKNRTAEVVERLAREIGGGRLAPGARLPTEQEMMAALGVSRTVVREAVAALRAQGLVTTRQGLGAFVASDPQRRPFRIDPDGLQSLEAVVDLMELRMAVEIETAGLAAERATAKQLRHIDRALAAMDRAIARHEAAIDEDYLFHRAIAEATGNAQFPRFLEYLGRFIIPRQTVRISGGRAYLDAFQHEHRVIHDAIRNHDSAGARAAMRQHLMKSRERYRKLAAAERNQ